MAKYDPLKEFLQRQSGPTITMSFADVGELVGGLPNSAFRHQAWWANERGGGHVQARAWLAAGWKVDSVNQSHRTVTFRRELGADRSLR